MTSKGRAWPAFFALALALCATPPRFCAGQVRISGQNYLSLNDWAEARNMRLRWVKRDESVELSNPGWRLVFAADSRQVQINGVLVWLLFPVLARNGALHITQQDAQYTLQPILAPTKARSGPLKTICLDAGHGGKDPGYEVGRNKEKVYTLLLAQELRQQLTQAGFKVTLTRTTDSSVDLSTRPEIARRRNADLFLSLHFNAVAGSRHTVQGAEVYCLTPAGAPSTNSRGDTGGSSWSPGHRNSDKSMFLAYQLQKSLTRTLGVEDRGVHRARFVVLREAVMPAVLIEAGFMSHPAEGRKIFTAAYRREIAQAIVKGVQSYKRVMTRDS